jgi:hypothetical protein
MSHDAPRPPKNQRRAPAAVDCVGGNALEVPVGGPVGERSKVAFLLPCCTQKDASR